MMWPVVARYLIAVAVGYQWAADSVASASLMTLALAAIAVRDLRMTARGAALLRVEPVELG